jgi:hypothetical protein
VDERVENPIDARDVLADMVSPEDEMVASGAH